MQELVQLYMAKEMFILQAPILAGPAPGVNCTGLRQVPSGARRACTGCR